MKCHSLWKSLALTTLILAVSSCGDSRSPSTPGGRDDAPGSPPTGMARCGSHPWCDTALSADQRAALLVEALTLTEKIDLLRAQAVSRLDIPASVSGDGPLGVRTAATTRNVLVEGAATAFPSGMALAANFDRNAALDYGSQIGEQARLFGYDWIYGPTTDINRTPLSGRSFEAFGEDPALQAENAAQWVRGAQSRGVMANLKHFIVNNQEGQLGVSPLLGLIGGRQIVNVNIDARTLHEIYLPPAEAAIQRSNLAGVMCSYNQINGKYACGNRWLLQTVLREQLGFRNTIISDLLAALTPKADLNAGMSWDIAGNSLNSPLVLAALARGEVTEETINARISEYLRTLFSFGFFDRPAFVTDPSRIDRAMSRQVAIATAIGGATLLKNNGVLPLAAGGNRRIAVIGQPASHYVFGYGSSQVAPTAPVTLLAGIQARAAAAGDTVIYDSGRILSRAQSVAATADVVIVVAADSLTEGADKLCMSLVPRCAPTTFDTIGVLDAYPLDPLGSMLAWGDQDQLIATVAAANPNTVVVLQTGGAILTPWRKAIAALLEVWYPGEDGGTAVAQVLYGDVDPAGRLPVTFPQAEEQLSTTNNPASYPGVPTFIPDADGLRAAFWDTTYSEGVFVGYRWFDEHDLEPAYPFGFGLSYTTFGYGELRLTRSSEGLAEVSLPITNTGARAGSETVQLYLAMPDPSATVQQPPRVLRNFQRIQLRPGETRTVTLALNQRDFSYYDATNQTWKIHPGCYEIYVGRSSRKIEHKVRVSQGGGVCA